MDKKIQLGLMSGFWRFRCNIRSVTAVLFHVITIILINVYACDRCYSCAKPIYTAHPHMNLSLEVFAMLFDDLCVYGVVRVKRSMDLYSERSPLVDNHKCLT
jgi:hypothetical protein